MDDLAPEDRRLLEVLMGRRAGSPIEEALRDHLMEKSAQAQGGDAASDPEPSPAALARRERMRAALIAEGALPPLPSTMKTPSFEPRRSAFAATVLGWLGLQPGRRLAWQLPVATMAVLAVGTAVVVINTVQQQPDDAERGRGGKALRVAVANPIASCRTLAAELLSAGLTEGQVIKNENGADACWLEVAGLDGAEQQQAAAAALAKAGVTVKAGPRLEVEFVRRK